MYAKKTENTALCYENIEIILRQYILVTTINVILQKIKHCELSIKMTI